MATTKKNDNRPEIAQKAMFAEGEHKVTGAELGDGTSPDAAPSTEELIEFAAPRDFSGRHSTELRVAVNGEMIRIKRGTTQLIKRKFVEALANAGEQDEAMMRYIDTLQKQSDQ